MRKPGQKGRMPNPVESLGNVQGNDTSLTMSVQSRNPSMSKKGKKVCSRTAFTKAELKVRKKRKSFYMGKDVMVE